MKILLLSDTHSPHTEKWALGLADRGMKIGLFSFNKASDEWYHHDNITVFFEPAHPINPESTLTKLSYVKYVRILKKIIRHFEPDILHAHYATSYGLIGALCRFRPYVLSVWGSDVYNFPTRSKLHRKVLQYNIRKADVILSTSEVMKREIGKYTTRPVEVTPFGVDVLKFQKSVQKTGSDKLIRVGTIKPLRDKYGISYIIQAAAILRDRGQLNRFRFYLVGAGEVERFTRQVAEHGLEDYFVLPGKVPFSDIAGYHNLLDIFLNVSVEDSESFGVATVEAMACERPVIVSDVGGLLEVVNGGEFGKVVPRGNAGAIADAILHFADNAAEAEELGRNARAHVLKKYNWQENLDRMAEIYNSLTTEKTLAGDN